MALLELTVTQTCTVRRTLSFHIKRTETCAWQKFWKEHLRDTKILFCGCGMKCFQPLRDIKILFCGCDMKCFPPLRDIKILLCGCGMKCFPPLRDTKILFCGCDMKCFLPLKGNKFLNNMSAKNLKQYLKSSHCGAFEVEDSKRKQNRVFNSWKVQWVSQSFLNGSPPEGVQSMKLITGTAETN